MNTCTLFVKALFYQFSKLCTNGYLIDLNEDVLERLNMYVEQNQVKRYVCGNEECSKSKLNIQARLRQAEGE